MASEPTEAVREAPPSSRTTKKISRRRFLGGATATAAFGIPTIIPSGVLALQGKRLGANDRVVVGNIGVGGMGSSHIRPDSAALCDVDDAQLTRASKLVTRGTPALYKDFRRLLERKDIDAVTIGTPDHWHGIMTVMACQAGKHVYCEKPTCKTIEEGRAMVNAARRYGRVVQIGMQGRSNPAVAQAVNYVRNGNIGQVKRVEIWHPVNFSNETSFSPTPVPSGFDWDMWVGPARWIDYHPLKAHFNFRWLMDSGEGFIRDRGNHAINCVYWMTGMDNYAGKVRCSATGTPKLKGMWDVPETMRVEWTFQDPEWTLVWDQPGTPNPRMPGDWGATYHGTRDSLVLLGGDGGAQTEEKARKYEPLSSGFNAYLEPVEADPTERHRQNWFNSIREERRPAADVEIGVKVIYAPIVGNISYRLGRPVTFDYATERFENDEEANRLLGNPYRAPWKI